MIRLLVRFFDWLETRILEAEDECRMERFGYRKVKGCPNTWERIESVREAERGYDKWLANRLNELARAYYNPPKKEEEKGK